MTQLSRQRKNTLAVAGDILNAVRRLSNGETMTYAEADRVCQLVGVTESKYARLAQSQTETVVGLSLYLADKV